MIARYLARPTAFFEPLLHTIRDHGHELSSTDVWAVADAIDHDDPNRPAILDALFDSVDANS